MPGQGDRIDATCLVMAGGEGLRLSPDKPLFEVQGRPIISRVTDVVSSIFDEVLLVTNTPQKYGFLGLPHVRDEETGKGPLMGIYSGLKAISAHRAFVCAADMPFLDEGIIRAEIAETHDHDMVVPCPFDIPEFLHGVYHVRCLPVLERQIQQGIYKLELLRGLLDALVLDRGWFEERHLLHRAGKAFTNINTPDDYRALTGAAAPGGQGVQDEASSHGRGRRRSMGIQGPLAGIHEDLLERIEDTLVRDESCFQQQHGTTEFATLWGHSLRVAAIAHHIAAREGLDTTAAVLAALFHDTGKFSQGLYHEGDLAEEQKAVSLVKEMLDRTPHEPLIPAVGGAILSLYREDVEAGAIGAVLYDADRIDKLGCAGIAQFFTRSALRGRCLDDDLIVRACVELTYASHAGRTLKTRTGREMSVVRSARVHDYFTGLIEEYREVGLGSFHIERADVEGISLVLVVPDASGCGVPYEICTDIKEGLKCRSAIVEYRCPLCDETRRISFCLPVLASLLVPDAG